MRGKFFTQKAVRPQHCCQELWVPHPSRCLRPWVGSGNLSWGRHPAHCRRWGGGALGSLQPTQFSALHQEVFLPGLDRPLPPRIRLIRESAFPLSARPVFFLPWCPCFGGASIAMAITMILSISYITEIKRARVRTEDSPFFFSTHRMLIK